MPKFDYAAKAELFDYSMEAELSPTGRRNSRRPPIGYKRFARAADAIRFAIEDLPSQLLAHTCLEVDETRYADTEIRRLYESANYPLARPTGLPDDRPLTHQERCLQQTISAEGG